MKPRTYSSKSPLFRVVVVLVCVFGSIAIVNARTQSRIFVRENFSTSRRDSLVSKLRKITGLNQLKFESDGSLSLGTDAHPRGSQIARYLLDRAAGGDDVIILEDASSRPDVAFCRVVPGTEIWSNDVRFNTHVVLIDFTDFDQIVGDKKARESFDVGWGLLHELDHVVSDTEDPADDYLGECEKHINEMRGELGLPLRVEYFYRPLKLKTNPDFASRFVSLSFEQRDATTGKAKTFLLTWDSTLVGGLMDGATASLK